MNLTIQPQKLTIQHPASKAKFQVMGNKPGVEKVSYDLDGVSRNDFAVPDSSFIFIGRNISRRKSVYTRLGMLAGELPIGCEKKELKNFSVCHITVALDSNLSMSNGIVHIISPDNKTIPLSMTGYNFSLSNPSRKKSMERVVRYLSVNKQRHTVNQKPSTHGCSDTQLTAEDLLEFIQTDALPKSFIRYFTEQLPLWIKVVIRDDNDLFGIENIIINVVQTTNAHDVHHNCRFPTSSQSTVVFYRPTVNFNISVENQQISLSSQGSCFATDICKTGVFLTLSPKASNIIISMPFMQDMANKGWEFLVTSFGFTTPRRYNRVVSSVPDGHLAEDFSDFHYNWWWQGSANIHLSDSGYAVNLKMIGEAFAFAKDVNAVSIIFFRGFLAFSKEV